ncbi:MAG: trans-aconitate 2-methyltransferase [Rhodospirillales bacterium]|nr:trans-aconitate 2-methyltransferase [Rhodospirillales bacterium]
MTHDWNPSQYMKFAGHRLRPALDLLARIDADKPAIVYDLGCGPGNVTGLLADRWPDAAVTGIDASADMLAKAKAEHPDITWIEADLGHWSPEVPGDVIYSNAALHWLSDHRAVFPGLMEHLSPGGVLAVQMPHNHAEPSHTAIREAAGPVLGKLEPVMRETPVAAPEVYYDILEPVTGELDIWETVYTQVLEGDNAVAEWTKGSVLKPLLDVLDEDERGAFFDTYSGLMQKAYPVRADGKTLFPFRRLFIVARP